MRATCSAWAWMAMASGVAVAPAAAQSPAQGWWRHVAAPADDLAQPVDLQAAADFNRLYLAVLERVANRPDRPAWNPDSFFRRFARNQAATP